MLVFPIFLLTTILLTFFLFPDPFHFFLFNHLDCLMILVYLSTFFHSKTLNSLILHQLLFFAYHNHLISTKFHIFSLIHLLIHHSIILTPSQFSTISIPDPQLHFLILLFLLTFYLFLHSISFPFITLYLYILSLTCNLL